MFAYCLTNTADLTQSTETARCSLGDVDPHGDVEVDIDAEVADCGLVRRRRRQR